MTRSIDLNADVGEGFGAWELGADEELLGLVSSANIACGFHAGDPGVMRRTVVSAVRQGVAVGAHPGYPDLQGFGRRRLEASSQEVTDLVIYQIGALMAFAEAARTRVRHVKPHGALYAMAMESLSVWEAIVAACASVDTELVLVGLAGRGSDERARIGRQHGIRVAREYFADRGYREDGSLVPRSEAGAVIHHAGLATERLLRLVREGKVEASNGAQIELQADTVCLHGDNPQAVEIVRALRQALRDEGIPVAPVHDRE